MKIWEKVSGAVKCAGLYVVSCFLDNLSSQHFTAQMQESNPFARHFDGSFWLRHALITEGVFGLECLVASVGLYVGASALGPKWARFGACVPWLYYSWLHLDAAFMNFLMEIPGLYQQSLSDMLKGIIG